ncbi:MAG: ATP synthase F1 subunit epsilon [Acidimicrobiia bacterium]|jgi:F-type H+-transporting ATPase subunit epsilon|nr:ATP synthase F1 subunit epsilon [Acidimicrobiia bacterium]MBP8179702.1 ATP synthase F1 subunit epsilon [Acidimicrobiia bacterium]
MPLHVELVSPEIVLFSGEADMVITKTVGGGDIAFLPGHAPFLGAVSNAPIRIVRGDETIVAAVHGGFVEVSDNRVTILADIAELAGTIDLARAELAKREAEAKLERGQDGEAEGALARAVLRIDVAGTTHLSR